MTVDNNEFTRIDRVAVVPLEDVSKLLMPLPVVCNRIGNHDLGVVCQAVAGALLCSVWDLVVYQVPPIALDWDIFKSVYAIFRSSSPGEHLFIGYYGVEELKEEDGAGIDSPEEVAKTIDQFLSDCYILEPGAQTLQAEVFKVFSYWSTFTSSNVGITDSMLFENLARRGIAFSGIGGLTGYGHGYFVGLESTGFLLENPKKIGTPEEVAIDMFLEDCYNLKPGAKTLRADVFKMFDDWSTANSSNVIMTNRMLSENLVRRGIGGGIGDGDTGYGNGFFIGLESNGLRWN